MNKERSEVFLFFQRFEVRVCMAECLSALSSSKTDTWTEAALTFLYRLPDTLRKRVSRVKFSDSSLAFAAATLLQQVMPLVEYTVALALVELFGNVAAMIQEDLLTAEEADVVGTSSGAAVGTSKRRKRRSSSSAATNLMERFLDLPFQGVMTLLLSLLLT